MKATPRRRRLRNLLALPAMLTLLAGTVVAAQPASASPESALAACRENRAVPKHSLSIVNSQWSAFFGHPDAIWPGDVVRITATGSIKIGSWPWDPSYGPEGAPQWPDSPYYPAPNQPKYSLAGLFSPNVNHFRVGRDSGCVQYRGTTKAYLALTQNDSNTADNSGNWSITVRHYWS